MKRLALFVASISIVAVLGGCTLLGTSTSTSIFVPPAKNADLKPQMPAAYQLAMASKKPKLLFFTTSYDPTRKDVMPAVRRTAKTFGKKIDVLIIAADEPLWSYVASDHTINYFPTTLILDGTGVEKARLEGFFDDETLEKAINDLLSL